MPIEIPSTYVNASFTGSGPVREIEKGSPEWKRLAAEIMGDQDLSKKAKLKSQQPVGSWSEVKSCDCRHCKREFKYTKHSTYLTKPVYCSDRCRKAEQAVKDGQCPVCESVVDKTVHNKKFCSKKCFYKWHDTTRRGEKPISRNRICDQCGSLFTVKRVNGKPQRFCKAACRIQWWREKESADRKARAKNRVCALPDCDNTFDRDTSKKSSQKYCGEACFKEARRRAMRKRRGQPVQPDYTTPLTCIICGDNFNVRPQNRKHACVCNKKECKAARRKQKRLENQGLPPVSEPD
jgi:hypothetical protein